MSILDSVETFLESAGELEQQGKFEEAISLYKRAEKLDSISWPVRSRHLRALYKTGHATDAEGLLASYLSRVEHPPGAALNDFGVLKAEQGDYRGAITCFAQALQLPSPASNPVALGNLAYSLLAENRLDECTAACGNLLRFDPDETRAHYILSVVEAMGYEVRLRTASRIIREGAAVQVFRSLRWDDQPMAKIKATITREECPQVHILEPIYLTRPGTSWGVLVNFRDELACGFSRQSEENTAGADLLIPLPGEFHLVQRRRWVRVSANGGITRLEVRSFPPGFAPFEVVKLFELNLSAGGAAVRTMPELPPNTEVSVFLKLDQQEEIEIPARVIRIGKPQAAEAYSALAFIGLEKRICEKIARFVHNVQLSRKRTTAKNQS